MKTIKRENSEPVGDYVEVIKKIRRHQSLHHDSDTVPLTGTLILKIDLVSKDSHELRVVYF